MRRGKFWWVYRVRGWLMVPPVLICLFVTGAEFETDVIIWPVAIQLLLAGLGLRSWSQFHMNYRVRRGKSLSRTGPYRFVRNPLYIGNTLILLGICVASELLWFFPIMLLWCAAVYNLVVRAEEAHLPLRYGDAYLQYCAAVPRWIPDLPPIGSDERQLILRCVKIEAASMALLLPFLMKELLAHKALFG